MTGSTKGPWQVEPLTGAMTCRLMGYAVTDDRGIEILDTDARSIEELLANARIMAASIDLVAVVEYALTIIEHLRAYSNVTPYIGDAAINKLESMAQTALKKVKGEEE